VRQALRRILRVGQLDRDLDAIPETGGEHQFTIHRFDIGYRSGPRCHQRIGLPVIHNLGEEPKVKVKAPRG